MVGAIPGALPPVIGWAAALDELSQGAWVLFGIVFLWQLPHFLAIAWIYREDYARAGFPMLPVDRTRRPQHGAPGGHLRARAAAGQPRADARRHDRHRSTSPARSCSACSSSAWRSSSRAPAAIPDARRLFFGSIIYLPLIWMLMIFDRT